MRSTALFLVCTAVAVSTASCKFIANQLIQRVDRWSDGTPQREGALADGMQTGEWSYSYPDGRRRAKGRYAADQRVGAWEFWYENGSPERSGSFNERGLRTGLWTFQHPNGALRARGGFADDAETGDWMFFDDSGQPEREGGFERGALMGMWTHFHADGSRKAEGMMESGQRVGVWRLWDAAGKESMHDFSGAMTAVNTAPPTPAPTPQEPESTPAAPSLGEAMPAPQAVEPTDAIPATQAPTADLSKPEMPSASPEQVAALEAQPERVPTKFQHGWTILEEEEVEGYVLDYLDGRSKKRVSRKKYGGSSGKKRRKSGPRRRHELEGAALPVTTFTSIDGKTIDTKKLAGKKRLMVVVLRGFAGEVCVYCVAQTEALARAQPRLDALDLEVLVIYPGPKGNEAAFLEAYRSTFGRDAPPYDVYYDPDLELVGRLGISGGDLAFPTTIITDKSGTVQYAYVGDHRADRPAAKKLVDLIEGLDQ